MPRVGMKRSLLHLALRGVAQGERAIASRSPELPAFRNFLLLEHSLALGTALHGTPLLSVLKATVPGARIEAAASGFGLGVLEGNPHLERLVPMPSPIHDLRGAVQALRAMRPFGDEPYATLHTTGNGRTRIVLVAMLAGAANRVGFCVHSELMRAGLTFDGEQSQIANNLRLVTALGHRAAMHATLANDPELGEPVLVPSPEDVRSVARCLREQGLDPGALMAVLVTQTSPTQRKGWRAERFRRVAATLWHEYGLQGVFVGTAGEAGAVEALRAELETPSANLAGKTSLRQMAALCGMARLAICLDTGPMHIARAMRTPLVVIAPAWSPVLEWLPVGNPRARILKNLTLTVAPPDYVIDEVSVEDVEAAVRDLLDA